MIAKKSALMVFAATIVISFALYLPALLKFALSLTYFADLSRTMRPNYWLSIPQIFITVLIQIPAGFAFFYFLAKKTIIHLDRSVVTALLAGVLVGNIPFMLLPYPLGWVNVFASVGSAMNSYLGALQSNIYCVFFPALIAILFVELKNKSAITSPYTDSPTIEE